ncbi:MAG: DUF2891 domain-containing protein [Sphingorhabdus sp.]
MKFRNTARTFAVSALLLASLAACDAAKDDGDVIAGKQPPANSGAARTLPPDGRKNDPNIRFASMALDCVNKQYPGKISHILNSAEDVKRPQQLYPAFYGCFDWHSSVHGHWLLARLWGRGDVPEMDGEIEAALARSFTKENIAAERLYFQGAGRGSFERPYGMAWFLQLTAELRGIEAQGGEKGAKAAEFIELLAPLETTIVEQLKKWLPKLAYPIRIGTHNQTAFAFGLMIDWARQGGDKGLEKLVTDKAMEFHRGDKACPIAYEPSGEDFFSPCLMEADLMRRVMKADAFASWLTEFLPAIPQDGSANWLKTGIVNDRADGKLVHLDGLNLSRAWALEGIASALPEGDNRIAALRAAAAKHTQTGLASVSSDSYAGSHWLASFATYLTSHRGIEKKPTPETDIAE